MKSVVRIWIDFGNMFWGNLPPSGLDKIQNELNKGQIEMDFSGFSTGLEKDRSNLVNDSKLVAQYFRSALKKLESTI